MHVLPTGFQKVHYYGFLNNRMKSKNLKLIFKLQGYHKFKQRYAGLVMADLMKRISKKDICCWPECGHSAMRVFGRTHGAFGSQPFDHTVFKACTVGGLFGMSNFSHMTATKTSILWFCWDSTFLRPSRINAIPIYSVATRPRIGTIGKNHIQSRFTQWRNLLFLTALNLILS